MVGVVWRVREGRRVDLIFNSLKRSSSDVHPRSIESSVRYWLMIADSTLDLFEAERRTAVEDFSSQVNLRRSRRSNNSAAINQTVADPSPPIHRISVEKTTVIISATIFRSICCCHDGALQRRAAALWRRLHPRTLHTGHSQQQGRGWMRWARLAGRGWARLRL